MKKRIGELLADASPPERLKFKPPLVLIHGLWTGSWCWREWATHFSNLGWDCLAINFRGRAGESNHEVLKNLTFAQCVKDLKAASRAFSFPPIFLAHCLGGLTALKVLEGEKLSALILLSSLPPAQIKMVTPQASRLLRLKYRPLIFLGRPFGLEEADFRRSWLASLSESHQSNTIEGMVPDSSRLISEYFKRRIEIDPMRIDCPILVVGGGDDRVVPAASSLEMAQWLGADFKEYPSHGHWMMEEGEGERIVREIHRWLVQKLGEEILLTEPPEQG